MRTRLEESGYSVRLTRTDNSSVAPSVPGDSTEAIRVEQEARIKPLPPPLRSMSRSTSTRIPTAHSADRDLLQRGQLPRRERAPWNADPYASLDLLRSAPLRAHGSRRPRGPDSRQAHGHFFSLRGPFPSVLVESLFLSNPLEAELLQQDGVREAIADGIGRGSIAISPMISALLEA